MGVEHASVEIEAVHPSLLDHKPLVINVVLVYLVVRLPNVLLVISSPKLVQVFVPLVEFWVCFGTKRHAELEEGQSLQHLVVCFVNVIGTILFEDVLKHNVKVFVM